MTAPKLDSHICRPSQKQNPTANTARLPPLSASPGNSIQGTYLENGHISEPDTPDGTPGIIYWFGTANVKSDDTLADVKQWTADGKGGDGCGKLLVKPSNFEDGTCVEPNDTPIANQRKAAGGGRPMQECFQASGGCQVRIYIPGVLGLGL